MKKTLIIGGIVFFIILFTYTNICYGLNATFSSNKTSVNTDEEITLTINFDQKIVAANFYINYDSSVFKFIEGVNINAAEKNGKIACIYADSTLKGTNTFSIKFKALKESSSTSFELDDVKVRELGQEESVTKSELTGLSNITVVIKKVEQSTEKDDGKSTDTPTKEDKTDKATDKEDNEKTDTPTKEENVDEKKDKTSTTTNTQKFNTSASENTSTKPLPATGLESRFILIIGIVASVIIAIISKKKYNNFKKIFTIMLFAGIGLTFINNTEVHAIENPNIIVTPDYTFEEPEEKIIAVMLPQNSNNLYITTSELKNLAQEQLGFTILSIKKDDVTELSLTDKVNTGAKAKVGNDNYKILIYGDANGDGDICDADDLMVIINDYLGKKTVTNNLYKHAADLANKDEKYILDTDDLMQMINMYLGKLKGNLVQELPDNELDVVLHISDSVNAKIGSGSNWNYTIYKDGTVKGEEWSSGSAVDFEPSKIQEYTVNLTETEVKFLKDLDTKYTDNEEFDEYFYALHLNNFNGYIDINKLNNETKEELKLILNKIFEYRRYAITIDYYSYSKMSEYDYVQTDNHSPEDRIYETSYTIDIRNKRVFYKQVKMIPYEFTGTGNDAIEEFEYAEKELSEQQIENIKNLYQKIENDYNEYTEEKCNNYCSTNNLDNYYILMNFDGRASSKIGGEIFAYIYKEEDTNILSSILDFNKSDLIYATVENNKSNNTGLDTIEGTNINLKQKGYDIKKIGDNYYIIVSSGENSTDSSMLYVGDVDIYDNKLEIRIDKTEEDTNSQSAAYNYSIIKINKNINDIVINGYNKVNIFQ